MDHVGDIEVPHYFLCPISIQIMRDPVTISTGITYDRDNIEQWLFSNNQNTCPITKQPLNNSELLILTPNHTLRRLIQSWCTLNASYGVERFPTPKPPATKSQILKLIQHADVSSASPTSVLECIQNLMSTVTQSEANKRVLETTPRAIEFLLRLVILDNNNNNDDDNVGILALGVLGHLNITDEAMIKTFLAETDGAVVVESLVRIMQRGNDEFRAYAIGLMKLFIQVVEPTTHPISVNVDQFAEVVRLLRDDVSRKDALKCLTLASPWGRNRVKAVEAGGVHVLVDMLLESKERRSSEMILEVLETLCGCAEGRAEFLSHDAGLAVVSKKILRVSHFGSDKGVRVLYSIAKYSGSKSVVQGMLELGVVTKLCVVLQVDCDDKTKERVRDVLRLHSKAWSNSPCAPMHVIRCLSDHPS